MFAHHCRNKPYLDSFRIFENREEFVTYAIKEMNERYDCEYWFNKGRPDGLFAYRGILGFELDKNSCKTIKSFHKEILELVKNEYKKSKNNEA